MGGGTGVKIALRFASGGKAVKWAGKAGKWVANATGKVIQRAAQVVEDTARGVWSSIKRWFGGRGAAKGGANGRKLWGRADTLDDHFRRHGADFGARNADDYAQGASDFFRRSQADGLPTKIGPDGTIRVYDPASNTFGSFNPDGTTKTFFKPSGGQSYWDGQPGGAPWTPK
jgi:hypothetical protein